MEEQSILAETALHVSTGQWLKLRTGLLYRNTGRRRTIPEKTGTLQVSGIRRGVICGVTWTSGEVLSLVSFGHQARCYLWCRLDIKRGGTSFVVLNGV